jgi:hypothetical protein
MVFDILLAKLILLNYAVLNGSIFKYRNVNNENNPLNYTQN